MIYCCEDCGFLFRPVTEEETKQPQTMLDKETQTRKGEPT